MLEAGADAKAADASGTTALMLAAAAGQVDAIRWLLQHGAGIDARDRVMERTALMFAAGRNRGEAIEALARADMSLGATSKAVNLAELSKGARPDALVARGRHAPSARKCPGWIDRSFSTSWLVPWVD